MVIGGVARTKSVLALFIALMLTIMAQADLVNVFDKGEGGYYCIKIPYLMTTFSGKLIAFGEARVHDCLDWAATDLVYKTSTDNGTTWSPLRLFYTNSSYPDFKVVIGNIAPVQDRRSGRIWAPFCRNNLQVLLSYSDTDGESWVDPVNITGSLGTVTDPSWTWVGTGPPGGIQLTSGRLIIPSYHSLTKNDDGEFSIAHIMYSDDGKRWFLGGNFSYGYHYPNENQAVELAPNQVWINARGLLRKRIGALSRDGGLSFDEPYIIEGLAQPMEGCEGSTIKHPKNGWLFYSGLDDDSLFGYRYNMTLFISKDQGKTWNKDSLIHQGPSAYSALSVLPDGSVACLWEWEIKREILFEPLHISYNVVWRP